MSDRSGQPHCRGDQRAGQSMQSYQSVWMAHWTRTSCSAAPQVQNGPVHSLLSNGNGDAKKFSEVTETRSIRMMNEGVAVTERLDCQPFPMFNVYQNVGSGLESNNVLDNLPHRQVSRQFDFKIENRGSTSVRHFSSVLEMVAHLSGPREHFFQSERISQCLEKPATQIIPCRSDKGKAPLLSFVGRQEKVEHIILNAESNEYLPNTSIVDKRRECNPDLGKISILDRDKNWDDHSTSGKFGTSVIGQSDGYLSLRDSSAGNNQFPLFAGEPSNATHLFQRMRRSTCDMKTIGIVTANSVDVLARRLAKFSQTNRNMLFVKNTDTSKSKQKQGLEESSDSMKSNRIMFNQLLSLSPRLCLGQRGVKIQLLDSSSDSRGNDNVREHLNPSVCEKNESSAETTTMDMDTSEAQNNLSGVNSSSSKKNFLVGHDPSTQATTVSVGKVVECQPATASLPDMNEILVLQPSSHSMDDAEPSTSRTQSLDAKLVLSHSEQPINILKKSRFPNSPRTLEPSSRWLKRLRLGVSHSFGVGTKSLNVEEALYHRKVNKLFSQVIGGNKTFISDQGFYKYDGKERNPTKQSATLLQKVESSSVDQRNKDLDILLSHSWIRRWCRAATQKKKFDVVAACEPQSSKVDFDELQNKQFPCMGTMALMGQTMNRFQPCESQKMGSVVVYEPQSTKVDFDELQNKEFPSIGAMALMSKAIYRFQPCEFRKKGSFVVWDT